MILDQIKAWASTLPKREIIGEDGTLYLVRYRVNGWMPGDGEAQPACNVYLHNILRHDLDDALHTHPWAWFQSTILHGGYAERRGPDSVLVRYHAGDTNCIEGDTAHRIVSVLPDTWTLVVTGPKDRSWGFHVPGRGFVPWRDRLRERGLEPAY